MSTFGNAPIGMALVDLEGCWFQIHDVTKAFAPRQSFGQVHLRSKLVGIVEEALEEGGIDPACLVLEITETAAIANLGHTRVFADRLRSRGCQVALADFGAGFASFYYLKNFPFDYLKIDGEFIRGLSANPADRLVVQAIVGIARGMGKKPSLSSSEMQVRPACSARAVSITHKAIT